LKQIILFLNECVPKMVAVAIIFVIAILCLEWYRGWKDRHLKELKKGTRKKAHGIIFGKKGRKLVYSPEASDGHVGVFSASGTGKTSSIGIPTLRAWKGTSYTIDIAGDLCKNCPDMPHKLVYAPEKEDTTPYNIFAPIDDLDATEDKYEALEQLAFLLMPEELNMNDNARFFLVNGRKILTASLIAFYSKGMDFIEIAEKIVGSSWQELFRDIDNTGNIDAIRYINGFAGANEANTAGCKQSCDDALKLFATNGKIKRSIRRPKKGEQAVEPKKIEHNNIFVVVSEDKLSLYAPLMNILTSQLMNYIGTREVQKSSQSSQSSPTILLFLDEYGSLKLDKELILDAVRRFRKRRCRIMVLMQNTVDLNLLYGADATRAILSNLKYKVLLGGLGEPESQKYFASLIGYKDSTKHSTSSNAKQTTHTESEAKEWVIEPAELDRQGKDTVILIAADEPDGYIKLKKNYYFKR
jgi:type IV secretory pathway TraG/TraD family ATPase VirD4